MKNYHNTKFLHKSLPLALIFLGAFGNSILSEGQVLPPPGSIPPPPSVIPSFLEGIPAPPSVVPPGAPAVPSIPPPASVAPPLAPPNAGVPAPKVPTAEPIFDETGFLGGAALFSDPEELLGIEGLDEPLDRIKLRDLPAKDALEMVQLWTGRYILRPQNLPQVQLNFDSFSVLTKREALMAIESLLTMNGIAMTKIDNLFWKAVPALGVNAQVPIWLEGSSTQLAPSQRIYIKMFHLLYAPAMEVREQLSSFATPNVSTLLVFEKANSILITDSLLNLQRMEKLLKTIDRPIRKEDLGTEFFIWETQHAGARELETKLKAMIEGSLKPFLGGTTQIDSDDRTGKLLVVTRTQNLETIQFLLDTLDSPIQMKTSSKLFKLQHAEAKDLKAILDEVIKNQLAIKARLQKQKSSTIRPQASKTGVPKPLNPGGAAKPAATTSADADSEDGSHEFSDFITISADERSNAILVYGTPSDISEIGTMIESLDQPLPMARIDTIFVMVDLTEDRQRGIDALLKDVQFERDANEIVTSAGPDGLPGTADDINSVLRGAGDAFKGTLQIPGLMASVPFQLNDWKLNSISWEQIFQKSMNRSDVRVFSTPSLMVTHNAPQVNIQINDERYVILTTAGTQTNSQDIKTINAKTELKIKKPKVGLPIYADDNKTLLRPGSIYMDVEVSAEKFDETVTSGQRDQELPGKKIRHANTLITAEDGEIIVIGGLQEVQLDVSETRYKFLSSLPYFGKQFFQPKSVKYTPTELLIFLRPTIIDYRKNSQRESTIVNGNMIDSRISPSYKPQYTSPTGKILNPTILDENAVLRDNDVSEKDSPSSLPFLNF
jgi:general secretion pathway protein D